jgi:hypothetical protein
MLEMFEKKGPKKLAASGNERVQGVQQ